MNVPLIQLNIKNLSNFVEQENAADAAQTAFTLANLLLQTPSQAASRDLYITYSGTVAAMKKCLDVLLERYAPTEDIKLMVQKIQEISAEFQERVAECEALTVQNQALLDSKQALEEQHRKLLDKKAEISRLTALKEKEIPMLEAEIASLENKLQELEASVNSALAEKEKWQAVFDENLRLIGDLPESVQDKTADEIIAAAKAYACQAAQSTEAGDEWLRQVTAAVAQSQERRKQSAGQS